MTAEQIKIDILQLSAWEHFKVLKDLSNTMSVTHPYRLQLQDTINNLHKEIEILKHDTN